MKNVNWIFIFCILKSLMKLGEGDLREDIEQFEKSHAAVHSRKRRYVVFPEGSTLTVATSLQFSPNHCIRTSSVPFTIGSYAPEQLRLIKNSEWQRHITSPRAQYYPSVPHHDIQLRGLQGKRVIPINGKFFTPRDCFDSVIILHMKLAACISPTALSGTGAIFTSGVAWALSYDLPNETVHTKDNKYEFPIMIRRHKRNLFIRMEKLMDSAGMDGKNCVLKTICETAQHLLPRQGILEEILRVLFTFPPEEESEYNWLVNKAYVKAHQAGKSRENCNILFPCPISLLEVGLGFGKYPQTYL